MTQDERAAVACPTCGGRGWVMGVEAVCCGNFSGHGDCLAWCALPNEVHRECPDCHGGFVDATLTAKGRAMQ